MASAPSLEDRPPEVSTLTVKTLQKILIRKLLTQEKGKSKKTLTGYLGQLLKNRFLDLKTRIQIAERYLRVRAGFGKQRQNLHSSKLLSESPSPVAPFTLEKNNPIK